MLRAQYVDCMKADLNRHYPNWT